MLISLRRRLTTLFVMVVFLAPVAQAQEDPDKLLLLGNKMFRSNAYEAAVTYYDRAIEAGSDTPLLYYNRGVAHYKLRQYSLAARSLKQSAKSEKLMALSYYNLGLVARAQEDYLVARGWFEAVLRLENNAKLKLLANKALNRIAKEESRDFKVARERYKKRKKPKLGDFDFQILATIGTDDNVYRSPDQSYVDLSAPTQPQVDPVVQSSQVNGVRLATSYTVPVFEHTSFRVNYRFNGAFYEEDFSNADRLRHRLSLDADAVLGLHKPRPKRLHAAFVVIDHDENNFDPDNGLDRIVNGEDVSGRFSYKAIGPIAEYRHDLGRWGYGFDVKTELRSYEEFEDVVSYNHDYYLLSGNLVYRVTPKLRLRGEYSAGARNYSDRPARDLTGAQVPSNPELKYGYVFGDVSVRYRLLDSLLLDAGFRFTDRKDEFLGYNDYTQMAYRFAVKFRPTRRFRVYGSYSNRSYDYPLAFAFDDPAGGPRELDVTTLRAFGEYRATRRFSIWAEITSRDIASSDPRSTYAKRISTIGVRTRL